MYKRNVHEWFSLKLIDFLFKINAFPDAYVEYNLFNEIKIEREKRL